MGSWKYLLLFILGNNLKVEGIKVILKALEPNRKVKLLLVSDFYWCLIFIGQKMLKVNKSAEFEKLRNICLMFEVRSIPNNID